MRTRERTVTVIICCLLLTLAFASTAMAADTVTEVSSVDQLKAALKDDAGTHVKLTADIVFTQAEAEPDDVYYGLRMGEGHYTIDLNGHKIEYSYTTARDNYDGSPLSTGRSRSLTVNGPGSVIGGVHGIEQDSRGTLTVNGGTIQGKMNSGIRATNGVTVINGGEVKGNFCSVCHEGGLVVHNGGTVNNIKAVTMPGQTRDNAGVIKNGVFSGSFSIEEATLTLDDLTISPGSTLRLARQGDLIVKNGLVNNGTFIDERESLPEPEDEESGPPPPSLTPLQAAEELKALGLFQGVGTNADGSANFDLQRSPSRVEALVMLIRLLGQENAALTAVWRHPFTDVPIWADTYVGYAFSNGLTKGVSATEFGVGEASRQMYLTFVLRALGYEDGAEADFTWDKPEELARSIGVMPANINASSFLRADVALISQAALSARLKGSEDTLMDKLTADGALGQAPAAKPMIVEADITVDTSWKQGIYYIDGIKLAAGASLDIGPGAIVYIGEGGFIIEGALNAAGTAEQPIIFTNKNGTASVGGISAGSERSGEIIMSYCLIEGLDALRLDNSSVAAQFSHCRVIGGDKSQGNGVELDKAQFVSLTNTLVANFPGYGLLIHDNQARTAKDGAPLVENCTVAANGKDGVAVTKGEGAAYGPMVRNTIIFGNGGFDLAAAKGVTLEEKSVSYTLVGEIANGGAWAEMDKAVFDKAVKGDPLFADVDKLDFHLKSTAGRWDGEAWVKDKKHSPGIDAGDKASAYKNEPSPNGGRINIGCYGNTEQASKSAPVDDDDDDDSGSSSGGGGGSTGGGGGGGPTYE